MNMNGKAIYTPKGKAGEYAKYAANFYTGCSNGCSYCYLKKGMTAKVLGGNMPRLKKCFRNEQHAISVYMEELFDKTTDLPKREIQEAGVFFTFTSDPCLPETQTLNLAVALGTMYARVPVYILTKCVNWIDTPQGQDVLANPLARDYMAVGFTLTGHDELEPGAATTADRQTAMRRLHEMGIRTFASLEPMVDIKSTEECFMSLLGACDLYKVGLLSGCLDYRKGEMQAFMLRADAAAASVGAKIYWKESVRRFVGPAFIASIGWCAWVEADYNMFGHGTR